MSNFKNNHYGSNDKYFTIRYRLDGKVKEEALGWASQGWSEQKAAAKLYELRENQRVGLGEVTLAEKRKNADEKRKIEETTKLRQEKEQIIFSIIFGKYIEQVYRDKSAQTFKTEKGLFDKWVNPILGNLPMKDISLSTLEKLKKNMKDAGRAPRTITYALAIVRQAFNYARNIDLYHGDNPVSKVKKPRRTTGGLDF
jgi:integrase